MDSLRCLDCGVVVELFLKTALSSPVFYCFLYDGQILTADCKHGFLVNEWISCFRNTSSVEFYISDWRTQEKETPGLPF